MTPDQLVYSTQHYYGMKKTRKTSSHLLIASPTLRLDVESVVVLEIRGVKYNSKRRNVRRHRSTKGKEWE